MITLVSLMMIGCVTPDDGLDRPLEALPDVPPAPDITLDDAIERKARLLEQMSPIVDAAWLVDLEGVGAQTVALYHLFDREFDAKKVMWHPRIRADGTVADVEWDPTSGIMWIDPSTPDDRTAYLVFRELYRAYTQDMEVPYAPTDTPEQYMEMLMGLPLNPAPAGN